MRLALACRTDLHTSAGTGSTAPLFPAPASGNGFPWVPRWIFSAEVPNRLRKIGDPRVREGTG